MGVLEPKYRLAMEKPLRVLEIFNDFFGESRVDLQGFPTLEEVENSLSSSSTLSQVKNTIGNRTGFILVHFPHITVTNEYNRSTDINNLFAKVTINIGGEMMGRFTLNRSEYSLLHFDNNYMHSHISQIPYDHFSQFQSPCTGSGPINNTICSLSREFDEDLWRLFCLELDKYVQVESVTGVPYHRLESLTSGGNSSVIGNYRRIVNRYSRLQLSKLTICKFIKHLIDSEVVSFRYINGEYRVAAAPEEAIIKVSNCFIDWYNKELRKGTESTSLETLLQRFVLRKCKFSNGQLLLPSESNRHMNYNNYIGSLVCTFKGREYRLVITGLDDTNRAEENEVIILDPNIVDYILTKIINIINLRYGNKIDNTPHKKVLFL